MDWPLQARPQGRPWRWLPGIVGLVLGGLLHLSPLDARLLLWVHQHPVLPDQAWLFLTQWGDGALVLLMLLAFAGRDAGRLALVAKAWLLGALVSALLKRLLDTLRPLAVLDPALLHPIGLPPSGHHSLPSGHALAIASALTLLIHFWGAGRPALRWALVCFGAAVAASRVAVGAHWLGDVLAGAGLGVLLAQLALAWQRRQPWTSALAKAPWPAAILALQGLLAWLLWRQPVEGAGMALASVLAVLLALALQARGFLQARGLLAVEAAGPGPARAGRGLRLAAGWVAGLVLLGWLLAQASLPDPRALLGAVAPGLWLLAGGLWACSFLFRAWRLRQEWRWKRAVSLGVALRVVLLHNAAVLLLPMRAGELGYPWLVRRVFGASWRESLRSLVWLRVQDAVVLLALAALAWPGLPAWGRALALAGAALPFLLPARAWRRLLRIRHPLVARLRPWMHRRGASGGWWLSLGNWSLKLLVVALLLHALAPSLPGMDAFAALRGALGGELAALIPVQGPAGLGTYEAAVWALSGLATAHAGDLAAIALAVHAFCLAVSLGCALLAGAFGRWPGEAPAAPFPSPGS